MSIIGNQIKKFRIEKGITQEQLGELLGVTTQAVSRWERGGTPDAELLPAIADTLNVNINALFCREEKNVVKTIAKSICRMPDDESFRYAFDICWAIGMGLTFNSSDLDDLFVAMFEHSSITADGNDYYSKVMTSSGMSTTRISQDLKYFFLMDEPACGIRQKLSDTEDLRRVFSIFADKNLLDILMFMYSRLNTPVDASLISKSTGLDTDAAERCMDELCRCNLASRRTIATENGCMNSYMFHQESSVIPLLCFADEIAESSKARDFVCRFDRKTPILHE